MYQDFFTCNRLVFGCGNPFFGDDGFGPAVIEHLEAHHPIPPDTRILDAGTSIRDILFDILLSDQRPKQIIIIDAFDRAGTPSGEIFEIPVTEIPRTKISDFSLHQFPTTNMLRELSHETGIDVRVLAVQISALPDRVRPGLSPAVADAVPRICRRVLSVLDTPVPSQGNRK